MELQKCPQTTITYYFVVLPRFQDQDSAWTKQEVLSTEDWYQVVEFGEKIYVFGNTGKIVAANLP